jgi:hypothetical protein
VDNNQHIATVIERCEDSPEYLRELLEALAKFSGGSSPITVQHLTVYHEPSYGDKPFCVDVDEPDNADGTSAGGDDGYRFSTPDKAGAFVGGWLARNKGQDGNEFAITCSVVADTAHFTTRVRIFDKSITAAQLQQMLSTGKAVTTIQEGGDVVLLGDETTEDRVIGTVLNVDNPMGYEDFEVEKD